MITFKKVPDKVKYIEQTDHTEIEMKIPDGVSLSYMLEEFEKFLKAIGYHFDGTLDFVDEE